MLDQIEKIRESEFEPIFLDVKERYLSSTNFPKLIIGTGLSVAMGVPGMADLAIRLEQDIQNGKNEEMKAKWESYGAKIKKDGLEAGLLNISPTDRSLVEKIKEITGEFILDEEYKKHLSILEKTSGLEKLLIYLSNTVSVNNSIIDIMTPNYDRIIEIICDILKLPVTLGFSGNIYQIFDENILKYPYEFFNKKIA